MVLCCDICELVDCVPGEEWIYECPVCGAQYSVWKDEEGKLHIEQIREGVRH